MVVVVGSAPLELLPYLEMVHSKGTESTKVFQEACMLNDLYEYVFTLQGGGHSLPILQQEIETVEEIHKRFPRFRSVPVYNDEADPLVGWSRPQGWRADVTYAALVIKVKCSKQTAKFHYC